MRKEVVCVLTGSINPLANMPHTLLLDVAERRRQYIDTIRYYLSHFDLPVVFVENSGHDLAPLFEKEIKENKIEILTFEGNNFPPHLGKGVGEYNCLKYAIERSSFIHAADFVFKITGRYRIPNLNRFIDQWKRENVYLLADISFSKKFTDSRFFGFNPGFLDTLSAYSALLDDSAGIFFEHILFKATLKSMILEKQVDVFDGCPRIIGIAGSMNQPYKSGDLRQFMRTIKGKIKHYFFHKS